MCVLIKHREEWLLWDTGYPDAVADRPVDTPVGHATRAKKLAAQLGELNLKPSDIAFVAVSHTHGDHVGNVDLFPAATLLIQKAEVDWAFAEGKPAPFKKDRPMKLLTGDFDVFGDSSHPPLDSRPHAGASVIAGASRQHRLGRADGRRRAFQGQLG
jgi:N-acyl homoserine lactone hydrolase